MNYQFKYAVGDREMSSNPGREYLKKKNHIKYQKKIKINKKKVISGGCG